ncbi:MAG TPA: response regulator [Myxococcales bacterium]|nr:response regulator [Myxococcales bacterium]
MATLGELVSSEKDRIVRLWAKRLVADSQVDAPGASIREPLARMVYELARLLKERGEDVLRLWPEAVRAHGPRRFTDRYDAGDLVREMAALQQVLLLVCARRQGEIAPEVAELIAELVGEATASSVAAFTRVLRTEEVRFREAALMESVLHHVDVGIVVAEDDGTITFATPPVEQMLGVPVRTLRGSVAQQRLAAVLRLRNARHQDGTPFRVSELPLLRAARERVPVRGVTCVLERPDGVELTVEMAAVPLFEDSHIGGELVGAIQTFVDRTESASKTRELSRAYRDLSEVQGNLLQRTRARALGQLAGSTAHALNNFLNVLRLRLTLLRKDARPDHLDALDRLGRNVGEMISRLQDIGSPESVEEPVEVDLEAAVREAIDLTHGRLEAGEHPVHLEVAALPRSRVRAEPVFLREVMTGLLLAAKDRMAGGGRLVLEGSTREDGAVLRLSDEGPPVTPEELAAMFDPLKGKPVASERSLLLGVARTEVQRWGGELLVEPRGEPAQGATFTLRLPLVVAAQPAARAPAAPAGEPERHRSGLKVLVVDDDPDNAWMLAQVLADEGYQVQVAHSASVARELWAQQRFDAALLDVMMPDVSGWELARELRQSAPETLLAMVTGADVRGQSRSSLAQVDAVFGKPIDVGALDEFLTQASHPSHAG